MNKSKGFTLLEIAIVITVIGILLAMIVSRSSIVTGGAKTADTITIIKDLRTAISDFRSRYHYLPGDMPMAGDNISGISATCNIATSTAKIGNGQLDTNTEVSCVAEHLVQAGLIKGSSTGIFSRNNVTSTPDVSFSARRTIGLLPPAFASAVLNEIMLTNQPCQTALDIDAKLDDGNFATGNIRASVTSCRPGPPPDGFNDPVPYLDIAF